jgi:hypothetical protein
MSLFTDSQLLSLFNYNHTDEEIFLLQMDPSSELDSNTDEGKITYSSEHELWDEFDDEIIAIMLHEDCDVADVCTGDYDVYTDEGADKAVIAHANSYFEDLILVEIPDHLHCYFKSDEWIDDYISENTRGEILSSYDGLEHEVTMPKGETLYLYRT